MINYYKLLGVSKNASLQKIREAYRKMAVENHPDATSHLPKAERELREQLMYTINEAWNTLSEQEKRKKYNTSLFGKSEGVVTHSDTENFEGFFSRFVKSKGILNYSNFEPWNSFFGKSVDQNRYFMISEGDWGLLTALKMAYESKEDGEWRVRKPEGDERVWIPDEAYSVNKKNGEISVFRRIIDLRNKKNREEEIEVTKDGSYFGNYLMALKSLAKKFAGHEVDKDGKHNVSQEFEIVNEYVRANKELVREVPFSEFWDEMRRARYQVRLVEQTHQTKEGGSEPSDAQYGSSGESLG